MLVALNCYGIVLEIVGKGGSIYASDLYEVCPHCNQPDCEFSCDESQAEFAPKDEPALTRESEEDVASRLKFNSMMDAIESLILAHAVAGIDVTSPAYLEGIETAVEACGQNA